MNLFLASFYKKMAALKIKADLKWFLYLGKIRQVRKKYYINNTTPVTTVYKQKKLTIQLMYTYVVKGFGSVTVLLLIMLMRCPDQNHLLGFGGYVL